MNTRNYYKDLGIQQNATELEIKKAYRSLALKWHPDHRPVNKKEVTEKMQFINEAYEVLSNPSSRKEYDKIFIQTPSLHTTSNTFFSNKSDDNSNNIYLPTAALFTGNPPKDKNFKVILIGSTMVGKSRFVMNLINDFDIHISTVGIDFKVYQPNQLKFFIYDCAGQERFREITSSYYRLANLILFFDDAQNSIRHCLNRNEINHEKSQLFSLGYAANSIQINPSRCEDIIDKVYSFDPYTAHNIQSDLFSNLEKMILQAQLNIEQSNDNNILRLGSAPIRESKSCCM